MFFDLCQPSFGLFLLLMLPNLLQDLWLLLWLVNEGEVLKTRDNILGLLSNPTFILIVTILALLTLLTLNGKAIRIMSALEDPAPDRGTLVVAAPTKEINNSWATLMLVLEEVVIEGLLCYTLWLQGRFIVVAVPPLRRHSYFILGFLEIQGQFDIVRINVRFFHIWYNWWRDSFVLHSFPVDISEPRMLSDLGYRLESFQGVLLKHRLDQVDYERANIVWELQLMIQDTLIHLVSILAVKGWKTSQHFE